jgi:uncharacterized protein (AIM24 family)
MGGLERKLLAGESLFLTRYLANGPGAVGITGPLPAEGGGRVEAVVGGILGGILE